MTYVLIAVRCLGNQKHPSLKVSYASSEACSPFFGLRTSWASTCFFTFSLGSIKNWIVNIQQTTAKPPENANQQLQISQKVGATKSETILGSWTEVCQAPRPQDPVL